MKLETKNKLFEAWAYCDWKDKSTEFMIAYMQDFASVNFDCVINFITTQGEKRSEWYKQNPEWFKKYES
jgi:hypothetical protein